MRDAVAGTDPSNQPQREKAHERHNSLRRPPAYGNPGGSRCTDQIVPLSTHSRRCQPQAILHGFEAAMEKAARVCQLARGREVVGIAACVAKLVNAERQRALHILAAADRALAELGG